MRDQSMRKSARSSTAVLVWTTVQQEGRSSGPAAPAVHRYGAEPSSHPPEAPDTSQLECQQSRQRRQGRRASGGCLLAPTRVVHGRVRRGVALAVSPPAPPSKRPCPTARRRGCSWWSSHIDPAHNGRHLAGRRASTDDCIRLQAAGRPVTASATRRSRRSTRGARSDPPESDRPRNLGLAPPTLPQCRTTGHVVRRRKGHRGFRSGSPEYRSSSSDLAAGPVG